MARESILAVEDEEDLLELLRYNLVREGYKVDCARTGEEAFDLARRSLPDLVLLDIMLPGMDGLEVLKLIRNDPRTAHISVIMLTARGEEADIVSGLEVGADDYVTKPFSLKVLVARVRAALRGRRRRLPREAHVVKIHNLVIDPARREVLVEGKPVELTATEFGILNFMCSRPGLVFTRGQIIGAVKGEDYPVTERSVDVQIVSLRKKLGAAGSYLETVRGVGYRFKE